MTLFRVKIQHRLNGCRYQREFYFQSNESDVNETLSEQVNRAARDELELKQIEDIAIIPCASPAFISSLNLN